MRQVSCLSPSLRRMRCPVRILSSPLSFRITTGLLCLWLPCQERVQGRLRQTWLDGASLPVKLYGTDSQGAWAADFLRFRDSEKAVEIFRYLDPDRGGGSHMGCSSTGKNDCRRLGPITSLLEACAIWKGNNCACHDVASSRSNIAERHVGDSHNWHVYAHRRAGQWFLFSELLTHLANSCVFCHPVRKELVANEPSVSQKSPPCSAHPLQVSRPFSRSNNHAFRTCQHRDSGSSPRFWSLVQATLVTVVVFGL